MLLSSPLDRFRLSSSGSSSLLARVLHFPGMSGALLSPTPALRSAQAPDFARRTCGGWGWRYMLRVCVWRVRGRASVLVTMLPRVLTSSINFPLSQDLPPRRSRRLQSSSFFPQRSTRLSSLRRRSRLSRLHPRQEKAFNLPSRGGSERVRLRSCKTLQERRRFR